MATCHQWTVDTDVVVYGCTGSFIKAGFSQEAVNHLFFGLFCCFLNFFLFPIAQEYHNNWEPALNGQKKWKTSGKLLKITNLQTPD